MRVAVIGHVEWIEFARVERLPAAGESVRAKATLAEAGVQLDVLVSSSTDEGERYSDGEIEPPPLLVARTAGSAGGSLDAAHGVTTRWEAAPLPGPLVDTYGAGDSFS